MKTVPASVTAVTSETIKDADLRIVSDAGDVRAEHVVHGVHGAQAEQRPLPRHRLEPGQSRHHDLRRRRAADERQRLEPGVPRRRPGGVRPRAAEPAVRPQHARRPDQRRQRANRAWTSGAAASWRRSATIPRARSAAASPGRSAARRRWGSGSAGSSATATRPTSSPATTSTTAKGPSPRCSSCSRRPRTGKRASIVASERDRDGDYALTDLGAARSTPFQVHARLRGLHRSRRHVDGHHAARRRRADLVHEQHRVRDLADAGLDRSRLHAAAAGDARQRGRSHPVHAGAARGVAGQRRRCSSPTRSRCGGRPASPSSPRTTISCAVNTIAPFVLSPFIDFPVAATSPQPRSTTSASASSGRAR